MGRFYLCGVVGDGNGFLVCDKKDYVVEFIHRDDVVPYLEAGIKIDGLTFEGDWLKIDVRKNKNLPNTRRSVTFRLDRPDGGYLDSGVIIINSDFNIEFIDITVGKNLVSNLGSSHKLGDFVEIFDGEDAVYPIVPELGYKLSICKNEDEAKDAVLKYFGGLSRLLELVSINGGFTLNFVPVEEEDSDEDYLFKYYNLYDDLSVLSIDEVIFDSKEHEVEW